MTSVLLALAGIAGVVAGLVLLSRFRQAGKTATWLRADLGRQYVIERQIYRHHRTAGLAIIAATSLWLWLLSPQAAWSLWLELTMNYLSRIIHSGALPMMLTTVLALLVLLIGVLLLLRPSLLKPIERLANRWMAPFPAQARPHSATRHGVHEKSRRMPGILGVALLLGGLACLWGAWTLTGN